MFLECIMLHCVCKLVNEVTLLCLQIKTTAKFGINGLNVCEADMLTNTTGLHSAPTWSHFAPKI